jgi:hypothetical protein
MEWLPPVSDEVVNVAAPAAPTVPGPSEVAPSKNVTVPVMVPAVAEVTVPVNVTLAPAVEGFAEEVSATNVAALPAALTFCVSAAEVLVANVPSPLYLAVMECGPAVSALVENVAMPPLMATALPSCVAPSKKLSVPVRVPAVLEVAVAVNVTLCPTGDGFSEEVTAVVVAASGAAFTTCETADDVLVANVPSPLYLAVMECVPCVSAVVERVAMPPLIATALPNCVAPSKKLMVPVSVPAVFDVAVAVNVIPCPTVDGFNEEVTAVVVVASASAFTTCETADEVLVAKVPSPLYLAVMECVPCVSAVVERVAMPPLIATGAPSCVAPSKKLTVPVSVPAVVDVAVAVKVTFAPTVEGFAEDASAVVVAAKAAAFTTCDTAVDVLAAKVASPPYLAVTECVPLESALLESEAIPPLSAIALPNWVAPSKKVTFPLIVPEVVEETVAVKVTDAPLVDGFSEDLSVIVVAAAPALFTTCEIAGEVLVA